jgi:hypothetical protein
VVRGAVDPDEIKTEFVMYRKRAVSRHMLIEMGLRLPKKL